MADFEWYRSFVSIYKHNSVSEAAKSRMMTQPAMSQHLASLEAEVGEPLFLRMSRKLVPTERGKQLYSHVAPLIESLEETTMSLKAASLPNLRMIKIGAAHEYYQERIVPLLPLFQTCTVSYFGTADQLLDLLKEEKADLVITSKKYMAPGIEYEKLCDEQFVVVAPESVRAPETDSLKDREQWLCGQTWISYGLDLPIIRRFWREHFKKRPLIKPVHILPNLHMILKAIRSGAGISLLPTYMLGETAGGPANVVYGDMSVRNELYFAYKLKHKHLPEVKAAMKLIRKHT
ncbi:LysR family transcriptional regulator [Paenibacillus flagellatus]|uniref:LysR family transcriptional regulator n=1 Tax=Paenibacillus flagellatus TaxID=2211139 RepID=A0A2V5JYG6_9BACL|nr:LysR family transcriptional regulator [Paenibacillus flagellatus]PYI50314.1 LysR family transcriptional regulator [Paenibacillus flagellatus]